MAGPLSPRCVKSIFSAKAALAAGHNHRRGNAGQASEMRMLRAGERERNQRRAAGLDGNRKLAGNVVAEPRRAHLRNRQSAGGDDERGRREDVLAGDDRKRSGRIVAAHFADRSGEKHAHAGIRTFAHQQVDNLLRRSVAEKLAQRLFVIRDAVPLDEPDEIRGRVARQRRFREVGIGREEIVRPRMQVGKVASGLRRRSGSSCPAAPRAPAPRRGVRGGPLRSRPSGPQRRRRG